MSKGFTKEQHARMSQKAKELGLVIQPFRKGQINYRVGLIKEKE